MSSFFYNLIQCLRTGPFGVSLLLILHAINSSALLALIPTGNSTIDGQPVSLSEFWMSGAGFKIFAYGAVSLCVVFGILGKLPSIRWVASIWFIVISVFFFKMGNEVPGFAFIAIGCICFLYLFVNRPVKEFFNLEPSRSTLDLENERR